MIKNDFVAGFSPASSMGPPAILPQFEQTPIEPGR